MSRYLLGRLAQTALSLLGILTVVFVVVRLSGDPAALYAAESSREEDYARVREELQLDKPIPQQYLSYLLSAVTGDLGDSWRFRQPALEVVLERVPETLKLASLAFALACLLGLPLGITAATYQGRAPDRAARLLALFGQAMPTFWLGIMLILLFSVRLGWLPSGGSGGLDHMILPAVTLSTFSLAAITRITRSALLDTQRQDYVRTARAKGLSEPSVLMRHSLRNAWIPVLTLMGLQFAALLQGSVVTEQVFSWPGMGSLAVSSIEFRDFPVVQAVVLVGAFFYLLVNLLVDLAYGVVDPRVRVSQWQR